MNEQLIILLGHAPGDPVEWLPSDQDGQPLGTVQRGSLTTAAAMAGDRRVVVFLPSEQLVLTEVTVPGLRGPKLRQAVPFALEDRVATDIETLHFACGKPDPDGRIEVAAVERDLLDRLLTELAAAGLKPAALVPDCLGLPWSDGSVSIAIAGERALLRDGQASGFACETAMLDAMLAARGGGTPQHLAVSPDTAIPPALSQLATTRLAEGLLPWLAPQATQPSLNLLQGDYAPRERRRIALGRWRLPAALAAAWMLLGLMAWGVNFLALGAEHRALQAEVAERFGRILPGEPMIDPRLQIERRLAGAGAASGEILNMLGAVGEGLSGMRGVQIGALSYRRGMLDLTVTAQRAEQIDQLRDSLATDASFVVSIESASSRGEQVEGRMQLRAASR